MKFSIGYQLTEDDGFVDTILKYRDRVYEVYFSFGDTPNGRHSQTSMEGLLPHEITARQLRDLSRISAAGIALNLLYNGNCYGEEALSRTFFQSIGDTVDYFEREFTLASVTTTSPLIARFIKENFKSIKTRASVNMEIGTREGMDYLASVFDGYYAKREANRSFATLDRLRDYCRANGKELFGLANSGCLNYCSAHIFHDNLVAHERELMRHDNAYLYRGSCWEYLSDPKKHVSVLRDTNYIRPEDVALYEDYFVAMKLATRVNANPSRVVESYMRAKHYGSPLELCEPCHAGALAPYYLDNTRIPEDFARRVGNCDKQCERCGYCETVFQQSIIKMEDFHVNQSND